MKVLTHPATKQRLDGIQRKPGGTYLFVGPAGVGKSTAARQVAANICQEASNIVIQGPNDRGSIGIDDILELERLLQLKLPQAGSHRVVIVEDADSLTAQAQNALLKTLEEPPANTTIILTCSQRGKLIPTILSRCKIVPFQRLDKDQITSYLAQFESADEIAPDVAAELSNGAAGVAHRLVNDEGYYKWLSTQRAAAEQLATSGLYERLLLSGQIVASKDYDPIIVAEQLSSLIRRRLVEDTDDRKLLVRLKAVERFLTRSGSNVNMKLAFDQLSIGLD